MFGLEMSTIGFVLIWSLATVLTGMMSGFFIGRAYTIVYETKRLKAEAASSATTDLQADSAGSTIESKAVARPGNLNWERLGLSKPKRNDEGTVAKIKINE